MAVLVAVACAAILAFPLSAAAFDVTKSTNGIFINRESTDATTAATVTIYYGYRGGETSWTTTYLPSSSGSYLYSDNFTNIWASDTDGMEFTAPAPMYRLILVRVSQSGQSTRNYPIVNEPLNVSVTGTPTVRVASMPAVAVSAPISLDSSGTTLAVDPWRSAGLPDGWQQFLVLMCVAGGAIWLCVALFHEREVSL